MAVKSLSFVDVPVAQSAATATTAFYVDLLGFQIVPRPTKTVDDSSLWLQNFNAGTCLHLVPAKEGVLAVSLTFVSDSLETLVKKANEKGIQVASSGEQDGRLVDLTLVDASGNKITLTAHLSPFSSTIISTQPSVAGESGASTNTGDATNKHAAATAVAGAVTKTVKRIAVLTSGGDSAGMNAALRAIVRTGIYRNCEIFAVMEGYQGMVDGGDKNICKLSWDDVSGILSEGGTIIGTARCKEMRTREGRMRAVFNLVSRGIDAIIVIGGDGSLTGANILRKEWPDLLQDLVSSGQITAEKAAEHPVFAVVGLVGSIDNDMNGTSMTIGADTALRRAVEAIDSLSSTAASHQRCFVVEIMGRNCGWLALNAALACGADWVLIPEAPSEKDDWESEMCENLCLHKETGKRKLMIMVSEGALDKNGKPIKSEYVRTVIETRLKIETRVTILGHVQRGGKPSAFDRIASTLQGVDAVRAVLEMTAETPAPMIGFNHNAVTRRPLVDCVEETQAVTKAMADKDFTKALQLRGTEFFESVRTFKRVARRAPVDIDKSSSIRIAIVHIGAPAGGVNAATRTIVRIGLIRGHTILGVNNSFEGLAAGDVHELTWEGVDAWSMKGGSELGTNRSTPKDDFGMVAFNLQKFNIHGLIIIGGFEGFSAAKELMESRSIYPQFCIPIHHIPATISNNVPGTELTLGADTALNIIIESIDEIRQSASSSKRRVFVVETMGGECGFLATFSSLGGGSTRCYVPEDGISFEDLAEDLEQLKRKFGDKRGLGRVIVRCENSSSTYTIEFIAALLNEEGKKSGLFDARTCNLGHLQQGGTPSPLDRVRGVRLASKCLDSIEQLIKTSMNQPLSNYSALHGTPNSLSVYSNSPNSVCIIGYHADGIVITPIADLFSNTDFKLRRPKVQWWRSVGPLLRILTGYD